MAESQLQGYKAAKIESVFLNTLWMRNRSQPNRLAFAGSIWDVTLQRFPVGRLRMPCAAREDIQEEFCA